MRAALTGKGTSPPIFSMLAVSGREESLARIEGLHILRRSQEASDKREKQVTALTAHWL